MSQRQKTINRTLPLPQGAHDSKTRATAEAWGKKGHSCKPLPIRFRRGAFKSPSHCGCVLHDQSVLRVTAIVVASKAPVCVTIDAERFRSLVQRCGSGNTNGCARDKRIRWTDDVLCPIERRRWRDLS